MKRSGLVVVLLLSCSLSSAVTLQVKATRTEWNVGTTTITARGTTKHPLWQQHIGNTLYPVMKGTQAWGVLGNAVWVTVLRGELASRGDSLGFRLGDGKKLWDIVGVDLPIARTDTELLFQWSDHANAYPDLRQIELVRVKAATGQQQRLKLSIPERCGCGDINKYSFGDLALAKVQADQRFIYAKHQDKCGTFTARFDWHGLPGQAPVLQQQ